MLEFYVMLVMQFRDDVADLLERVGEDEVVGHLQIGLLPVVLPVVVALGQAEDAEIHRAHVERGDFGRCHERGSDALIDGHADAAAGGDVHHRVGVLLDAWQEFHEHVGVGRRLAGFRVARVQVNDRGAGLGRTDRSLSDLVRCDRQVIRHGRGVDRAGDRARNNYLALFCHESPRWFLTA